MRRFVPVPIWVVVAALPATALACPVCDAGTGRQVRAALFDDSFGANLMATLLPFPVVAGVVAAIHFARPTRRLEDYRRRGRRQAIPSTPPERKEKRS